MSDPNAYLLESTNLSDPAISAAAIVPHDDNDLTTATRAIYTGTGGTLIVNMRNEGSSITFSNVPAGTILPIRVTRVLATGTVGSGYVALY